MRLNEQLAMWADRLRDLSALGLYFAGNLYDRQHYQAVQDIAMAMFALLAGELPERLEPLRGPVFSRPTPFAVGDAAIIDDRGQILLIRRADNGKWAMPGGALEVGETPAEGVLREAFEETGVRCQVVTLIGVFDSRLCGTVSRHHMYQITFLCRPVAGAQVETPSHANEVLGMRWFAQDALPDDMEAGHGTRIHKAFRMRHGSERAFFD